MKNQRVNPLTAALGRAIGTDTASPPNAAPPARVAVPPSSASASSVTPADPGHLTAPAVVVAHASAPPRADKDADLAAPHIDLPTRQTRYDFQPRTDYSFRVRVPGHVAARYVRPLRDVEEVMEERLVRCVAHDAETPLTFTDDQRRELLTLLGTADPESVLRHLRNLTTASVVSVNPENGDVVDLGMRLRFTTEQLERAGFRCVGAETLEQKLQEFCDYGVNANVGLS